MKTKPMSQQVTGTERLAAAPEFFALGAEQGTGKTWMLLADAERQWENGDIQALLVLAPKGVHTNWVLREIPTHLEVPHVARFWLASAGVAHKRELESVFKLAEEPLEKLVILSMNIDAIVTPRGRAFVTRFLETFGSMIAVDESHRVKNPDSGRSKELQKLKPLSVSRRIASGTLVANTPLDLFGQYNFLRPGLLGTRSYRAFVSEYAEILPPHHPLVQEIMAKSRARGVPQVIAKDREGKPVYKNLEKLRGLIEPHTYRVLKKDCLDLPDKIYQTHYYELPAGARKLYNAVKKDKRYMSEDGEVSLYTPLTLVGKLRQITSGFLINGDGELEELSPEYAKPRLDAVVQIWEDAGRPPTIVWATFHEELRQLRELFGNTPISEYNGEVSATDREAAVDDFQNGTTGIFLATAAAGGTGLTLTRAALVIYYSCSHSLVERLQSEDRSHRIGTRHPVVYYDVVARDTIDERIAISLQNKEEVAAYTLAFDA